MAFLNLGDAELFYERPGARGPAVVLVHGGMCSHRDWKHQAQALSKSCRVLTLDLRGHGQSAMDFAGCTIERWADDLNALVDRLELAPAVLVGHSLASRIVAEASWRRPDNSAALVLVDGSRSHGGFSAREANSLTPPPMQAPLVDILNKTIGPYADAEARAQVIETMSAAAPEVMAACVTAMRDWDLGRADGVFSSLRADMPVLAIQSTYHDQFTPRRSLHDEDESTPYLDFLRGAVAQLEVVILPETGHFSMLERPDTVTALIADVAAGKK